MALNFTVVVHVRQQFGDTDQDIGVFAGREKSFSFDCPSVSSGEYALMLFQSVGVGQEQVLQINGVPVFGGVPASPLSQAGNVLIINQGVLRNSGNVLRIASEGDEFVIDNVVVLYKTRQTGPVIGGGSLATER
jgi:hypothetical protein